MTEVKNIVITGASRGLGAHLARRFAAEDANLLLVARDVDALQSLQDELGEKVFICARDLAQGHAVDDILGKASDLWPRIDVLINNAGIQGPIGPGWAHDRSAWEHTLAVNLLAPVALCHAFVPGMIASGSGRIINLSGGGGTAPRPKFSAYATAKAGLVRFSETLAAELCGNGVSVNCVAPGAMASDMLRQIMDAGPEATGKSEHDKAAAALESDDDLPSAAIDLIHYLACEAPGTLTGKLISALWDPWREFQEHGEDLETDIYTLRRIVPGDRGMSWGDG